MNTRTNNTAMIVAAGLLLFTGLTLFRSKQAVTVLEEEKSSLQSTVLTLSNELTRITRQLETAESKSQRIKERIVKKKDGTEVVERTTETVEDRQTSEKQETEKQTATTEQRTETVTTEKSKVTVETESRLGLDVGAGVRVDRQLGLGVSVDLSYEVKYRLAPRIGVELDLGGKPKAGTLGVEVKL